MDVEVYGCTENCCFLLYLQLCFFDGDASGNGIEQYANEIVRYRMNGGTEINIIVDRSLRCIKYITLFRYIT